MTETRSKVGRERNSVKLIKRNCIKPIANIMLMGERQYFPLKMESKVRVSTLNTFIQHHIGNPSQYNKERKGNKKHTSWKRNKIIPICIQYEKVHWAGQRWQAGLTQEEVFRWVHAGGQALVLGKTRPAWWVVCKRLPWDFYISYGVVAIQKTIS